MIALGLISTLALFLSLSSAYALYVHLTKPLDAEKTEQKEEDKSIESQKPSGLEDFKNQQAEKELETSESEIEEKKEELETETEMEKEEKQSLPEDLQQDPDQSDSVIARSSEPAALDLTEWIAGKGSSIDYSSKSFSSYQKAFDYANSTNGHFKIEGLMENNQISYIVRFLENEKGGME